ncbi:hypothetical protein DH2020_045816 [Rehmannia glutinosa]|uniref:Uncharacterized protein n=1 Tax=Rehmannia glutinosa TaxID=99300 RepID=A0ABR0UDS2_REHGL
MREAVDPQLNSNANLNILALYSVSDLSRIDLAGSPSSECFNCCLPQPPHCILIFSPDLQIPELANEAKFSGVVVAAGQVLRRFRCPSVSEPRVSLPRQPLVRRQTSRSLPLEEQNRFRQCVGVIVRPLNLAFMFNRALRQATLGTLITLMFGYGIQIGAAAYEAIVCGGYRSVLEPKLVLIEEQEKKLKDSETSITSLQILLLVVNVKVLDMLLSLELPVVVGMGMIYSLAKCLFFMLIQRVLNEEEDSRKLWSLDVLNLAKLTDNSDYYGVPESEGLLNGPSSRRTRNNAGYLDSDMIVILNDHIQFSLPTSNLDGPYPPIGALSSALCRLQSDLPLTELREVLLRLIITNDEELI